MSASLLDELKEDINERQEELFSIQVALEAEARRLSNLAKYMRIAVIFLGAFAATRDAADGLFVSTLEPHQSVMVIYTLLALAITVIGSISATFRPDNTAAELKILAAECNANLLAIDCRLPRKADNAPVEAQIEAAHLLILYQNEKISEVRAKAARIGMLIERKIRKLSTDRTA
ncbi:MAG: hypothetical protein QOG00_3699 [Pyrinomonadaceae bacterium]|nr:hypothetical protein [Pyrinomonadaceae bacterium]